MPSREPDREPHPVPTARGSAAESLEQRVLDLLAERPSLTAAELAEALGVSTTRVMFVVWRLEAAEMLAVEDAAEAQSDTQLRSG
jgi:predicted ArsR family transcriptional regulator